MAVVGPSEQEGPELQDGLISESAIPRSFFKDEIKTMAGIGWPMLVSFFCRMGMASEDSAFVGHLSTKSSYVSEVFSRYCYHALTYAAVAWGYHALTAESPETESGYGPKEYLAAAGLSDMVTSILIIPPLAFNQSLNALVSQAMGSGNKKMAGTWLQLSVICLTVSHLPVLPALFFVSPMLQMLGFDATICSLAGTYAKVNAFWPIPNGWYQCMRFYFQAQGITRPAMYNNIFFLLMNALLNWVFVFGGPFRLLGWHGFGFIGAAISLSLSRSLQPLFYWIYMFQWRKAHIETWPSLSERTYMKYQHIKSFMKMSLPQLGTMIFQAITGQAVTLLIAKLGDAAIAASAASSAATQVFTGGLPVTLSMVGGIRVGFFLGKGQPRQASAVSSLSLMLGVALTGSLGLLLVLLAHQILAAVTDDPSVIKPSVAIMPAVVVNLVASTVVSITTQGILTSQGRTVLVSFLSMGLDLPLSIGSIALLVLVYKADLITVYWAQAGVSTFEAVIAVCMLRLSDWKRFAKEARERQSKEETEDPAESQDVERPGNHESMISMQEEVKGHRENQSED